MNAANEADKIVVRFGRYRVVARLGRGGMADVFLTSAQGPKGFNKLAVVKVLRAPVEDASPEWVTMFFAEAELAARLAHENIVQTFEVGEQDGVPFMAMEYLEGKAASEVMRALDKPLPRALAARIVSELLDGLQYAHELCDYDGKRLNVIHRDVSPNNILITYDGLVKILDFGIAKTNASEDTAAGVLKGKVSYMAPEQASMKPVDQRADIFSAGVVLWELLAGRRLNRGTTAESRLYNLLFEPKPLLSELVPDIDPALEAITVRALQAAPADRYQTAREMRDELQQFVRRSDLVDPKAALSALIGQMFGAERETMRLKIREQLQATTGGAAAEIPVLGSEEQSGSSVRSGSGPTDRSRAPHLEEAVGTQVTAQLRSTNHLPAPLSELVGRTTELSAATHLMGQTRMLTLTGPGGSGKTSLAIGVGHALAPRFPGGCFYVSLAAVSDPTLVFASVAEGLGIRDVGGQSLFDTIVAAIGDRRVLLVIDNFEQLVEAGTDLSRLLQACRNLRLIVTSRIVLHVQGEREMQVPPLETPDLGKLPPLEKLREVPALRLFCDRAEQVGPFVLTEKNAMAVAMICSQLDGLPLAIELAAARTKVLPPQQLVERLSNRLKLLTGGARNVAARQRTLRDTIAWSYDLLTADEQQMFNRLGVFAGGFSLEAAEAVCGDDSDVLDSLSSLVDKSLLRRIEDPNGAPRFLMLETLREFGLEQLKDAGALDALQRRHAEFFHSMANELGVKTTVRNGPWARRIAVEQSNLRAAIAWSCANDEADIAMHMIGDLWSWYWLCFSEGRSLSEQALRVSNKPTVARSKALFVLSIIAWGQGDFVPMRQSAEENLELSATLGDEQRLAWASLVLALGLFEDMERGQRLLAEAKDVFVRCGRREAVGLVHGYTGITLLISGQGPRAREEFLTGRAICLEVGDEWSAAIAAFFLSLLALQGGELEAAREYLVAALPTFEAMGDVKNTNMSLIGMAGIARLEGNRNRAESSYAAALRACNVLGDIGNFPIALEGVAASSLAAGDAVRGARLLGAVDGAREAARVAPGPFEPMFTSFQTASLALAKSLLGDDACAAAMEAGRRLTREQIVRELPPERIEVAAAQRVGI